MATEGRRGRRRQRNNKLKRASRGEIPAGPMGVHHIPDHLLEVVLLRVGSSLALLRAAFTCKRWRRIVADTGFLSRFRSLHATHVPGHYHVVDPSYAKMPPDVSNQVFVPDVSTADPLDSVGSSLALLRAGSSLALLRAAFTCKRWRRIVADTGFLSRFRSLHATHVPGHYHVVDPSYAKMPPDVSNQVFVPDVSTADPLDRRHFSVDFLPDVAGGSLELADSRGGLLLLYRTRKNWSQQLYFPDLIVCEPLTRRYQGIVYPEEMRFHLCFGAFLLDGNAVDETGGCIGMSNFRVIAAVYESAMLEYGRGAPRACVFSSGSDGGWVVGQSAAGSEIPLPAFGSISFVGRVCWSRYWAMEHDGLVLALDETTTEFSLVTFPETVVGMPHEWSTFRVIGGEHGAVRVVRLINNDLRVFAQLRGSGEWVAEKLVRLPEATYGLPGRKKTYFQRPAMIVDHRRNRRCR